jgi:hypothetical protein
MDPCPSEKDIERLVQIIRTANVRNSAYKDAEREILKLGQAAQPILVGLLSDLDVVVRERATELLKKLATLPP